MEDGEVEEGMLIEDDDAQSEVEPREQKSPYELLQESKASVEDIVAKMVSIKKEGKSKSKSKSKSDLRELVTQMFLHFVTLRQVPPYFLSHSRVSSSQFRMNLKGKELIQI